MNRNIKAHFALLGANTIYGLNFVIAKGIMPDFMMPRAIILLRVVITVGVFGLLHFIFPKEKVDRRDLFKLFICAFFGVAINQILFFEGLNLSTPINASIIVTVIPVLILVFAHYILKEKITTLKVIGIIMGATGAVLIILSAGNGKFDTTTLLGNFLIFVNATSWALYLVLVKPLMQRYESVTVMKWVFFFGLIIILPFTFTSFTSTSFSTIPPRIWFSLAFIIFGATIVAYYLNNYSLKSVSPSINGIYIYLQPLIAAFLAILYGKDHLTVSKTIAAILIMGGVYFVTRKPAKKTEVFPPDNNSHVL